MGPRAGVARPLLALLAALLPVGAANAQVATIWRVAAISPANSLICLDEHGTPRQVVLAYLSIPAGRQPYGVRAAAVLRAQLVGRDVNIRAVGPQGAGYLSALVYVGRRNFNEEFLRRGHAWVNHLQDPPSQWRRVEATARSARVGLWATPAPIHPIDWASAEHQARDVRGTLDRLAADQPAQQRMLGTFIGRRSAKRYYPFQCALWLELDHRDVVVFTSARSAQAAGYRAAPCRRGG